MIFDLQAASRQALASVRAGEPLAASQILLRALSKPAIPRGSMVLVPPGVAAAKSGAQPFAIDPNAALTTAAARG